MVRAIWNGKVVAESENTIVIENNHYFSPEDVKDGFFNPSSLHSHCPWKGDASYYNVEVDGETNKDAAWYYPEPKKAAENIKDYVAFWKGVEMKKV